MSFINSSYAIMRHAYQSGGEISTSEQNVCRKVVRLLAEKTSGKKIRVFHSGITRARQTAEIVASELAELGFTVSKPESLHWLEGGVRNYNISKSLTEDQNDFTIFVSHQPDVEEYTGSYSVSNCDVFSKDFKISRHDAAKVA